MGNYIFTGSIDILEINILFIYRNQIFKSQGTDLNFLHYQTYPAHNINNFIRLTTCMFDNEGKVLQKFYPFSMPLI